jgi:uncharacterized protein
LGGGSNNERGFRIERRIGSGVWSRIARVRADMTKFTSTGLKSSTSYGYRVGAYNKVGASAKTGSTDRNGKPRAEQAPGFP